MKIKGLYEIFKQYPNIQTDSRKLQKGDLFFALKGDNFNGNEFAQQVIDQGATYAVIDDENYFIQGKTILVDDVLSTLQDLSSFHRDQLLPTSAHSPFPLIAITGSNGKTTTKELLTCVLSKQYKTYATQGNYNNHIGVPLTLLEIKSDAEVAIVEMGANHLHEIEAYCKWAKPNFALINNCGKAHLEGFGGLEGVRKGKGELYDYIREVNGTIFRNADLGYLRAMAIGINKQETYGCYEGHIRGRIIKRDPFLEVAILTSGMETTIQSQLVGDYNVANILGAIAVGHYFGVGIDAMKEAIEAYVPSNNRSQHLVKNGINIILDAYNANPTSMLAAIQSFAAKETPNKIMMLGGMKELGTETHKEHLNIIAETKKYTWKAIVLVGPEFNGMQDEHNIIHFESSTEAKSWYENNTQNGDWVYIKGSRLSAMEKIVEE